MMPNPTPDEFERSLSRQPLKSIPGEWRASILAAASSVQRKATTSHATAPGSAATVRAYLVSLLWPHPKAWAALATAWVVILALHLATRETSGTGTQPMVRPSAEVLAELRAEHKLYAELLGTSLKADADRPRTQAPGPRSGRLTIPAA
jgi:hypothetical protein